MDQAYRNMMANSADEQVAAAVRAGATGHIGPQDMSRGLPSFPLDPRAAQMFGQNAMPDMSPPGPQMGMGAPASPQIDPSRIAAIIQALRQRSAVPGM